MIFLIIQQHIIQMVHMHLKKMANKIQQYIIQMAIYIMEQIKEMEQMKAYYTFLQVNNIFY